MASHSSLQVQMACTSPFTYNEVNMHLSILFSLSVIKEVPHSMYTATAMTGQNAQAIRSMQNKEALALAKYDTHGTQKCTQAVADGYLHCRNGGVHMEQMAGRPMNVETKLCVPHPVRDASSSCIPYQLASWKARSMSVFNDAADVAFLLL